MDDKRLIELYFKRDEDAIRLTQEKYGAYCFKVANNILASREDAEECVNDTYLKAWNTIPPQRPNVLKLFLARITRNLSIDRYEKRAAEKRGGGETELAIEELSECVAGSSSVEGEVMRLQLEKSIDRFISDLPERERAMFLRRYFYLESHSEMAERFGIDPHALSVILDRTRKKLRKHLKKEGFINDR